MRNCNGNSSDNRIHKNHTTDAFVCNINSSSFDAWIMVHGTLIWISIIIIATNRVILFRAKDIWTSTEWLTSNSVDVTDASIWAFDQWADISPSPWFCKFIALNGIDISYWNWMIGSMYWHTQFFIKNNFIAKGPTSRRPKTLDELL